MKKEERLLNALTNISDDLITEAAKRPKRLPWRKLTALAACAALIIGISSQLGGGGGSGGNVAKGLNYDRYVGPVLPLTVMEKTAGLNAVRNLTYDFAPYTDRDETLLGGDTYTRYYTHTLITDAYTLTNTTNQDMTVTAVYPFPGSLSDFNDVMPSIAVDGETAETSLAIGEYLGSYLNVGEHTGSYVFYERLLSEEEYITDAFAAVPALNQPVTVYRLHDLLYDGPIGGNPTLAVAFSADPSHSRVLFYGGSAMSYDDDGSRYCLKLDRTPAMPPQDTYIVVLGEDIDGFTLQTYSTAACEPGTESEGYTVSVERTETTLGQFLMTAVDWEDWRTMYNDGLQKTILSSLEHETMVGCTSQLMEYYGATKPTGMDDQLFLEDYISSMIYSDRILYVTCPVTIPAGESVSITAHMVKDPSIDHHGKDEDRQGYDMMTQLGSSLFFTEQTVSIVNTDSIVFIDQNFGFDLDNGVTTVTLDLSQSHYWMNVRKAK